jgi:hypothetical protein
MTDPRTPILNSVSDRQSYDPTDGDFILVGIRPAFVMATGLLYDDGMHEPIEALHGRAVTRLDIGGTAPSFLDVAWPYAITTVVPEDMKAAVLLRMAARAPTVEDAVKVKGWALDLSRGKVPTR